MNDLKNFTPDFLKVDEKGKLYAQVYFEDYEDLSAVICGLGLNIDLVADLMQECAEHRTHSEIGQALKSVTRILEQLNWSVYEGFELLDRVRKQANA